MTLFANHPGSKIPCSLLLLFALSACSSPVTIPTTAASPSASTIAYRQLDPFVCDNTSTKDTPTKPHLAGVATNITLKNKLLVFLPGTSGTPGDHQKFLKVAALAGYHVLGLQYPNAVALGDKCGNDLAAYGLARQEICTGTDSSPITEISVSSADSIQTRLLKAIQYLNTNYPSENWASYLSAGTIDWSKIFLAGYSQGAGHAAWLAANHPVAGVLLFSGVVDASYSNGGGTAVSATWLSDAATPSGSPTQFGATARSKFRWFVNTGDGFYSGIKANLQTMGFGSAEASTPQSVDGTSPPYNNKTLLATSHAPNAHASTCEDASTPLNPDSSPIFSQVWNYLLQ